MLNFQVRVVMFKIRMKLRCVAVEHLCFCECGMTARKACKNDKVWLRSDVINYKLLLTFAFMSSSWGVVDAAPDPKMERVRYLRFLLIASRLVHPLVASSASNPHAPDRFRETFPFSTAVCAASWMRREGRIPPVPNHLRRWCVRNVWRADFRLRSLSPRSKHMHAKEEEAGEYFRKKCSG